MGSDPQDVVTSTIAMKLLENHTMEPLQKLYWLGILTAFLPFLMFTSAQNINIMARDNLSPVCYNPKNTNPLSNQMGKLQSSKADPNVQTALKFTRKEFEPEAEAQPAPDAYHGYRGKRSPEPEAEPVAKAQPEAVAEAEAYRGYGGYGG